MRTETKLIAKYYRKTIRYEYFYLYFLLVFFITWEFATALLVSVISAAILKSFKIKIQFPEPLGVFTYEDGEWIKFKY